MVNRLLWLAAALALGITAAGCKMDENYELPPAKGKIIINSIPEKHNGKYVFFSGPFVDPITLQMPEKVVVCGFTEMRDIGKGENESIKLATISEGKAEIPLYIIHQKAESFSDYIQAYSGNDVFIGNIFIFIVDDEFLTWQEISKLIKPAITMNIRSETDSDGNFTVDWPEGPPEEIEEGEDD